MVGSQANEHLNRGGGPVSTRVMPGAQAPCPSGCPRLVLPWVRAALGQPPGAHGRHCRSCRIGADSRGPVAAPCLGGNPASP